MFALMLLVVAGAAHGCPTSETGCCCCEGACIYKGCPPCPCPAPAPGHPQPKCPLQQTLDRFESQYLRTLASLRTATDYPSKTTLDAATGVYTWETNTGWTSGFFPGLLWQLSSITGNKSWAAQAANFTAGRASEQSDTSTHDVGFMVYGSFGVGLALAPPGDDVINRAEYKKVLLATAHSLSVRYSRVVGMTRSWGSLSDNSSFEVIIDNLMNLELLFWAAENGGTSASSASLKEIATSHVHKTAEYWIRADGSTPHLCIFNPGNGTLKSPCTGTPQGYAATSTWARGQAWAIYGFTMAYRYLRDPKVLAYAEKASAFWLKSVKPGGVSIWDFDAPTPTFEDTSAAAIVASAFAELATYTKDKTYADRAVQTIATLTTDPRFVADPKTSFAVTMGNGHDCGSAGCTIIEPEFYLLEAIRKLQQQTV